MDYNDVKKIAQLALDTPYPRNEKEMKEYSCIKHILLSKDDPVLKHAMKYCDIEFEITETMTSDDGWKKFRKIENFNTAQNVDESKWVTWDGYKI